MYNTSVADIQQEKEKSSEHLWADAASYVERATLISIDMCLQHSSGELD